MPAQLRRGPLEHSVRVLVRLYAAPCHLPLQRLRLLHAALDAQMTQQSRVSVRCRRHPRTLRPCHQSPVLVAAGARLWLGFGLVLGLGVGIVADMAHDLQIDGDLIAIRASHLFKPSVTSIAFRRGTFLRGYMYRFVNLFAPHLSQDVIGMFLESQGRGEAKKIFESIEIPTL